MKSLQKKSVNKPGEGENYCIQWGGWGEGVQTDMDMAEKRLNGQMDLKQLKEFIELHYVAPQAT